MRAVWSFWSKPYTRRSGRTWREPQHHLMAWGLSLHLARRHFAESMLVTDTPGKALLVDRLGLEFDEVSTELDCLTPADADWWALGKLVAYGIQDRPFVHLDTDVFLWQPLLPAVSSAPVFTQCPEYHSCIYASSRPQDVEQVFARFGLELPMEWQWTSSQHTAFFREENCGLVGGNHVAFLRYFGCLAADLITNPAHAGAWAELPCKDGFNMVLEQFLLAACIQFHRNAPDSPFRGVGVAHVFPTWEDACSPELAARAGFTHLLGDAKGHHRVTARLERRMTEIDPAFTRHCLRVAQHASVAVM